jgi:predicted nicotinamide N-methyase
MNVDSSTLKVSSYDGPTEISTLVFGGRQVHLVRPTDPDRLLEDPAVHAWNELDDYMPYWAYVWPGAYFLAEALGREAGPERPGGVAALEIGCGLGLAGLLAVARGWHVTFTDYDETALEFVRRSAAANAFDPSRYATTPLDWRDPPAEEFPVILGADVLYERRLVPLVANLLARMLSADGFALIAGPCRVATEGFARAVATRGLKYRDEPVSGYSPEQGWIRGTLYRVWK